MKIGQFIKVVQSTKDTIRHYEALNLIQPEWQNNRRIYNQQEVDNFYALKEMQSLGMSLKEIQVMFDMKRTNGCGSSQLLKTITEKLLEKRMEYLKEEDVIKKKRTQIEEMVDVLKSFQGS